MVNNISNGISKSAANAAYKVSAQANEQEKLNSAKQTNLPIELKKSADKDSVAFTPQAKQLKDLQKRMTSSDGFDKKKVDDIKQAISNGDYKINYERLAEKLSNFELYS